MKSVLKKLVTLLLVGALVFSVTACGTGGGSTGSGASADGKIRVATADPNVPIDPHKQTNSYVMMVADSVLEPLIKLNNDETLSPCLIKDMPTVSEDGLTYTFELKDGVQFHDGTTLKASDVKYSFERLLKAGVMSQMIDKIVGAQEVIDGTADTLPETGFSIQDDTHFTITLTEAYAPFEKTLATSYCAIVPEAAATAADAEGDNWGRTTLVGTGPYKMDSYTSGQGIELSKFDSYHGEAAKNNGVTFKFMEDTNTQEMEFEQGNIDIMLLDATLYTQFSGYEALQGKIYSFNPYGLIYLTCNMQDPIMSNQKVREALSLSIDREAICDDLLSGTAKVANTFIPEGMLGYDENAAPLEYNPEKAKQLLAEAGYPDGVTIDMPQSSKYPFKVKIATAIQDQARASGFTINVEQYDGAAYNDMANGGKVQVGTGNWYVDYVDPDGLIYQTMSRNNTMSESSSFYNSDEFNNLLNQAQTTSDEAQRQELYAQADNILTHQDYAAIPICNESKYYLCQDWVNGFEITNVFKYDFSTAELA